MWPYRVNRSPLSSLRLALTLSASGSLFKNRTQWRWKRDLSLWLPSVFNIFLDGMFEEAIASSLASLSLGNRMVLPTPLRCGIFFILI